MRANGIEACDGCGGNGFVRRSCNCREAACPHEPMLGDPTDEQPGLYAKFWVRRTDGSSGNGEKHAKCDYLVLDWTHDPFAIAAGRAYADACEATHPDLAADIRKRAADAERAAKRRAALSAGKAGT